MKDDTFERIAEYMEVSAITAPNSAGIDSLVTKVVTASELEKVGEEMIDIGEKENNDGFIRDGNNVLESEALLLIGSKEHEGIGLNCGACGNEDCESFNEMEEVQVDFTGPNCLFKMLDLGIALGSAAKTAAIHNVDTRIMYKIGVAARDLEILDATVIMGIPLSGTNKSPYFDR